MHGAILRYKMTDETDLDVEPLAGDVFGLIIEFLVAPGCGFLSGMSISSSDSCEYWKVVDFARELLAGCPGEAAADEHAAIWSDIPDDIPSLFPPDFRPTRR